MRNWKEKVLDDGFVRVVSTLGDDLSVVQAARVCTGTGGKGDAEDRKLIDYLMKNRHTTPFEMCEIKLHVRVPMDTWRQWIRHRTASVNERSSRYTVLDVVCQQAGIFGWRKQSKSNRQGSDGVFSKEEGIKLHASEAALQAHAIRVYKQRIEMGVAREQARKDLPLSTYTEAYWKIDLHNLLHFLELRMAPGAQLEIREYANTIAKFVSDWVPWTWEAFTKHRLET